MKLTNTACKNAKPSEKGRKLSDGHGLYLEITPKGGKYWRMKYRFDGKEKRLSFGVYPEVSLAEARERKDQARQLLRNDADPSQIKKAAKLQQKLNSENSFESVAREWLDSRELIWTERHTKQTISRLESDIFPVIGSRTINEITAPELLSMTKSIENRGAVEMAHRAMQTCGQIFRYAIATGKAERDISADLRGALKPVKRQHLAYLKADELPAFLEKLEAYEGELQTKLALKMLLFTFVRTRELRMAVWEEINFDKAEWRIPGERMKMKELHIVPLSKQAIAVLREQQLISGNRQHIFPNRSKPMHFISENTLLYAIYRMGYHSRMTAHGFRATASTILNESGFRSDVIERQLAHGERNKVRASYNHAQYLPERTEMMQWWADYVDGLVSPPSS